MPADAAAGDDRTVLFYRDFRKFHGGHLKVWDYFNHVAVDARLHVHRSASPTGPPGAMSNPWWRSPELVADDYDAADADLFFVAGRDWHRMDAHPAAGAWTSR